MAKKKKVYRKKPPYNPNKAAPKKPPMSKQTKLALMISAGVLVLAVILFAIFYSDGSLPVKKVLEGEGAQATTKNVVQVPEGENWLIINKGTSSKPKYYKLGSIDLPDTYRTDEEWSVGSDSNIKQYHLLPNDEASPIKYVHIQGVNKPANEIAPEAHSSYGSFYAESEATDIAEVDFDGVTATWFAAKFGAQEQDGLTKYHQSLTLYLPAVHEGCVLINIMAPLTGMDDVLQADMMLEIAREAAASITLDTKK